MKRFILFLQLGLASTLLLMSGCATVHTQQAATVPSTPAHHIALLLPLSGPLAPYGTAIRNGFFTAYYQQKQNTGTAPSIDVLDTNGKSIQSVYQDAITQGADFIVGPLNKADVVTLVSMQVKTPVLALNTTDTATVNPMVTEFALSPTDEAQQAAVKIAQDGHHHVLILAPNTAYGMRLVSAFSNQWKTTGGNIVATEYYNDISTLSKSISDVLQITQGYADNHALEKMFHQSMRYIPERRQDFDSVFLVATPAIGKQAALLLRFYFAGNVPTYATSQIYPGHPDADLQGIQFCDMPWIVAPTQLQPAYLQTIQQTIQATWPDNYARYAKFYAMGVDAYNLIPELPQMRANSKLGFPAATGVLYLSPQNRITRQLMWMKI